MAESVIASPEVEIRHFLLPPHHYPLHPHPHPYHHHRLQFRQPICDPRTTAPSPSPSDDEDDGGDSGMIVRIEDDEDDGLLVTDFLVSV